MDDEAWLNPSRWWNSAPNPRSDYISRKYCSHEKEGCVVDWGFGPVHCRDCGRKGRWVEGKVEWEVFSEQEPQD